MDIAPTDEKVLNQASDYPLRIVHGLIDLLATWHQSNPTSIWVMACDNYHQAGPWVQRFFSELMRRCGQRLNLMLLLAVKKGWRQRVVSLLDDQRLAYTVQFLPEYSSTQCIDGPDKVKPLTPVLSLEANLPQYIWKLQRAQQWEDVLTYQLKALEVYTEQGLYEDAIRYGEAALPLLEYLCPDDRPQRWTLYAKLSTCYVNLGRFQQALHIMEEAMLKVNMPEYLFHCCYRLAMLYTRYLPQRDLVKAEVYLEQGLAALEQAQLPASDKLFHQAFNCNGLALVRLRQGKLLEALELCQSCYEQLSTRLPLDQHLLQRSVLLHNLSRVHSALREDERAIAYLSEALKMDSNNSEYYNDRGNLYLQGGKLDNAKEDYLKAIELSPPYAEVWVNLGQCYRQLGHMQHAIEAYARAIDLAPTQVLAWVGRAQAWEASNQAENALADYSVALELDPHQPLVLANRAALYYEAGQYQLSLADLNQAIALTPDNSDLYQNRALVLAKLSAPSTVERCA
jgi:tetratricopeptide (TPR) repeat protein